MIPLLWALLALESGSPQTAAHRIDHAPVIDGRLDEAVWQNAPVTDAFTQQYPLDKEAPTERTTMRVLYDDEAVYFGFELEHKNTPIFGRLTRRDRDSESEWISVQIDTRREGKAVYTFGLNVVGVVVDAIISEPSNWNFDWDEVWEARSARTPTGWTAEFKIPLRILRFDATQPVQSWGLQAIRYLAQNQEFDLWSYVPRDAANPLARFGRLDGLENLKPGGALELRPFAAGHVTRQDATDQTSATGISAGVSGGLDLKWHATQDLTLDAAFLPDFAQVEADQLILNLTNYETLLPEKRPLFLEGAEVFSFPLQIFYSRRIGNVPTAPTLLDDMTLKLVNVPSPAQIYGAAKLVGHLGQNWTIGALTAVTGRNEVVTQGMDGMRTNRLAAPLRASEVLRIKREWGTTGHIGFFGTATNTFENGETYPGFGTGMQLCPSGTAAPIGARCFRESYVAGIDALWHSPSGDYSANAALIESFIHGGLDAVQLDGTKIGPGARAPGAWLRLAKDGGKLLVSGTYSGLGQRLDYNDLGYMQRQNLHEATASVGYRTLAPGRLTTETVSNLTVTQRRSLSGLDLGQIYELNTKLRFLNYWSAFAALDLAPAHYDDREVGDGTALERGSYVGARLDLSSDPKQPVAVDFSGQMQSIERDAWYLSLTGTLSLNLLPQFELTLSPVVTRSLGERRFAWEQSGAMGGNEYVFGSLDAKSVGATLRAGYTFAPRISLTTYAQAFLASGSFTDRRVVAAQPGARVRLDAIAAAPTTTMLPAGMTTPDFEQAALNLSVVFGWEYLPGSTLYLVYSRSQLPSINIPDLGAHLAPRALGRGSSTDVVFLKLTYWWAS
ncbi:MAG TPA: DUF5916 domain-containing protein [Polyangia bacterium]|nr:DUF5916 domain-containing protein [Polyangia bacterium]